MQGAEELGTNNPMRAYYKQTNPLYLPMSSYLTGAHDADRFVMLTDAGRPRTAPRFRPF